MCLGAFSPLYLKIRLQRYTPGVIWSQYWWFRQFSIIVLHFVYSHVKSPWCDPVLHSSPPPPPQGLSGCNHDSEVLDRRPAAVGGLWFPRRGEVRPSQVPGLHHGQHELLPLTHRDHDSCGPRLQSVQVRMFVHRYQQTCFSVCVQLSLFITNTMGNFKISC